MREIQFIGHSGPEFGDEKDFSGRIAQHELDH